MSNPDGTMEDALARCSNRVSQLLIVNQQLRASLKETLALAFVSEDGDPWFASNAGIDAEAVYARARAALDADTVEA